MMQLLLNSSGEDIPMNGVDWIILLANGVGVAIVALAVTHANAPDETYAQGSSDIEISSLN